MNRNTAERLSPRKLQVLAAIVESYVATGEPVGSKSLAERLGVSSATIRNEMAALAEIGYLEQPHTSAGRIPSQRGYRMYVDHLMGDLTISPEEQMQLDRMLMLDAYEPEKLLENVSRVLASLTRFAALSTTPSGSNAMIRGVQFVQTGRRTAMVILMMSSGVMKNRVFKCDFDITPEMMRIFFRVLNERLAGQPLKAITPPFMQGLAASLGELAILMSSALRAVLELAQDSMEADIRLNGQMNLLFYPEFDSGRARRVMDFLESRKALCSLLFNDTDLPPAKGPVRILIGTESHRPELQDSSIIVARYDIAGQPAGAIGILGPTRMDYRSLVAHLSYLSRSVGRMLTDLMSEES
ncbi:MAG: heat-inducible transcriptional repressor HrcA [Oscillospiraceae bacterium]|nr:heat-inducible transcriptional repressor HrcA [Oscillospiraceae bacterium]